MENNALVADDKLKLLRRLDSGRAWQSTHERRLCLACGKIISGSEIRFSRGLWGLGLLRLECPTEDCPGGPLDWVDPDGRFAK